MHPQPAVPPARSARTQTGLAVVQGERFRKPLDAVHENIELRFPLTQRNVESRDLRSQFVVSRVASPLLKLASKRCRVARLNMALTTTASTPTIIVPKSSSPFGAGLARQTPVKNSGK